MSNSERNTFCLDDTTIHCSQKGAEATVPLPTRRELRHRQILWAARSATSMISSRFGLSPGEWTEVLPELQRHLEVTFIDGRGHKVDLRLDCFEVPEELLLEPNLELASEAGYVDTRLRQYLEHRREFFRSNCAVRIPSWNARIKPRSIKRMIILIALLRAYFPDLIRIQPDTRATLALQRVRREIRSWRRLS